MKEVSNCCESTFRVSQSTIKKGDTYHYICDKCDEPCDVRGLINLNCKKPEEEIKIMSWVEATITWICPTDLLPPDYEPVLFIDKNDRIHSGKYFGNTHSEKGHFYSFFLGLAFPIFDAKWWCKLPEAPK